ncbi:MAG: hypothetical protein ACW990_20145 [Promethearchaeota archaeon]
MKQNVINSTLNGIVFIGNYLPRQCGIAKFINDLGEAIAQQYSSTKSIALAKVVLSRRFWLEQD